MNKTLCLILSCCIILSGCADNYHWTDHCDEFSADRVSEGKERENYNPFLTPVSDPLTECYCYTEDTVITAGMGAGYAVLLGGMIMAEGGVNSDNVNW